MQTVCLETHMKKKKKKNIYIYIYITLDESDNSPFPGKNKKISFVISEFAQREIRIKNIL